jgi:hypothetical protein
MVVVKAGDGVVRVEVTDHGGPGVPRSPLQHATPSLTATLRPPLDRCNCLLGRTSFMESAIDAVGQSPATGHVDQLRPRKSKTINNNSGGRARGRGWSRAAATPMGLVSIAPLTAVCGGGGTPASSGPSPSVATGQSKALPYAQCVRAHAVPKFPDPGANGNIQISGSAAGVALGVVSTAVYAHAKGWVIVIPPDAWAGRLAAAIAIGAIAGLLPAIRAACLSLTQALWSL